MGKNRREADDVIVLSAMVRGAARRLRPALPRLTSHLGLEGQLRSSHGSPRALQGGQLLQLVVVEGGSHGLAEASAPHASNETVVITQDTGEPPSAFARRTIQRLLGFEQSLRCVERLTLLLAPCFNAEATAARTLLARALMTHSAAAGSPATELVLDAGTEPTHCQRVGLLDLADALIGKAHSSALPIQLLFAHGGSLVPPAAIASGPYRKTTVEPYNIALAERPKREPSAQEYLATMVSASQGDVGQRAARQARNGRSPETDE